MFRRRLPAALALAAACLLPGVAMAAPTPPTPSAHAPAPVPAAVDPLAAQLQQAVARQAQLDALKASLAGTVSAAREQQQNLSALIQANRRAVDTTMAQLADSDRRLQEATARQAGEHATAEAARQREARDRALLARDIRMRYLQQDNLMDYLLSSESIADLMGRSASLSHISQASVDLLSRLHQDEAEADSAEAAARRDAAAAVAAAGQLVQQKAELEQQTANAADLIGHLGAEARAATAQMATATAQDIALAEQIAEIHIQQLDATIAAAQEAAWQAAEFYVANHVGSLPPGVTAGVPVGGGGGGLLWAAPGATLSQPFGPSPYPFEPSFGPFPHFHTGIDMAAPLDTPIIAAADGVVASATESSVGYGNHLVIAHSTTTLSLYGHLATMLVHTGDTIHRGQLIGLMGSTGNSTGPHLHFEVRVNNVPTDPAPLLAQAAPGH